MTTKPFRWVVIAAVMLGGFLLCSTPASARGIRVIRVARGHHSQLQNQLERLARELNLTNDQKQQLRPILQQEAQKLKTVRKQTGVSREQQHQQLKQIHQDFLARVKAILTPEQLEKWQTLHGNSHSRHKVKM